MKPNCNPNYEESLRGGKAPEAISSTVNMGLLRRLLSARGGLLAMTLLVLSFSVAYGAANHVVISEFATHNGSNISDEFVELYNPTPNEVSLANWILQFTEGYKEGTLLDSKSIILELNLSSSTKTTIRAFGHLLIGITSGYSNTSVAAELIWYPKNYKNMVSTASFPLDPDTGNPVGLDNLTGRSWDLLKQSNGSLILMNPSRTVIDKVGWANAVDYENSPCVMQGTYQQSIKRLPESEDTDNNYYDFRAADIRDPMNYSSVGVNPVLIPLELDVSPRVFSSSLGQKCIVSYSALPSSKIRIRIFDVLGRQVRSLLNDYPGGSYVVYWDGTDDMQSRVSIGYYIVHLQSYDSNGRQDGSKMKTVVVGTPLQ